MAAPDCGRIAPGSYYANRTHPIDPCDWHSLPFYLRQRWWRQTDFDRRPPSDELMAIVMAVLAKGGRQ